MDPLRSPLEIDVPDTNRFEESILHELEADVSALAEQLQTARRRVSECLNAMARYEKESKGLKLVQQQARTYHNKVQDDMDNNAAEDGRLEALRKSLTECHEQLKADESAWVANGAEKETKEAEMKGRKADLDRLNKRIARIESDFQRVNINLMTIEDERSQALVAKNKALEAVQGKTDILESLQRDARKQADLVDDFKTKAAQVGPRVPIDAGETMQSLDKKLVKLDQEIKRSEARFVDQRRPCILEE